MANLPEAQQVKERLKPLRRILDDLDAAIDFASKAQSDFSSYSEQVPKLYDQVAELIAQKTGLEKELEIAKAKHAAGMEGIVKESERVNKALREATGKLRDKLKTAEEEHVTRMAQMEREYEHRLQDLQAMVAAEEAKRDQAIHIKELAKAEVARL